ncbi:hypothetical protein CRUP_037497 [Coryphaenoides rupestris]|nr:hypothetical protein CRUP_037497 [Coryphaenoides rupestris]
MMIGKGERASQMMVDSLKIYPVLAPATRTRLALVITNVTFDHLGVRNGAEKDEQTMKELLRSLGYIVAMDKAVKDFFEDTRLPFTDSVFVVIMSHGKMGGILGVHHASDEKPDVFPIDNIYKHMDPKKCGGLRNKPKVIIIQACRGDTDGSVLVMDGPGCTTEQRDHGRKSDDGAVALCQTDHGKEEEADDDDESDDGDGGENGEYRGTQSC